MTKDSNRKAKKGSRRVYFAENKKTVEYLEREESAAEKIWYTKTMGDEMRDACIRLGRVWKQKGCAALIDNSFEKPTKDTQLKLFTYCTMGDGDCIPRGLERFISTRHGEDRKSCKSNAIECIVDRCTALQLQASCTMADMEEELYKLSIEHSKPARKFARRMGLADERAVLEDNGMLREHHEISTTAQSEPQPVSILKHPSKRSNFNKGTKRLSNFLKAHSTKSRGPHSIA